MKNVKKIKQERKTPWRNHAITVSIPITGGANCYCRAISIIAPLINSFLSSWLPERAQQHKPHHYNFRHFSKLFAWRIRFPVVSCFFRCPFRNRTNIMYLSPCFILHRRRRSRRNLLQICHPATISNSVPNKKKMEGKRITFACWISLFLGSTRNNNGAPPES